MDKVVIIGAGQLGSRHLQGLKTASSSIDIWVLDNNPDSLNIAEERYNAVQTVGVKNIHFVNDINLLPDQLDIVIVATGSKPRASIVKSLTKCKKVQYLVLEKVLFPKLSEYNEIDELLKKNDIKCWVNCPRRMYDYYQKLHDDIDHTQPLQMTLIGRDWGLCCNSMHFIDAFKYLCDDEIIYVDNSAIIPKIIDSKRSGYIELNGRIEIASQKGHSLILESTHEFDGDMILTVQNGSNLWAISEPKGQLKYNNDIIIPIRVPFQSQLTGMLIDMILKDKACPLTPYSESAKMHKLFVTSIIDVYNKITGEVHDSCPIT